MYSYAGLTNLQVIVLIASIWLSGCTTPTPLRSCGEATGKPTATPESKSSPESTPASAALQTGHLMVYSATYVRTIEQSEFPAHSDYSIATTEHEVIEHVANSAGPFDADPAKVALPAGKYQIRAQYDGGGFVEFSVAVQPGKTTIVALDNKPPRDAALACEPIRLPDGRAVGWLTMSDAS